MTPSDPFDSLFPPGALKDVLSQQDKDGPGHGLSSKGRKVWKVSELLDHLNNIISMEYGRLWVEGEISSMSIPPSGHHYFTLKDGRACLRSVLFKTQARDLGFSISEGQRVLCLGRLNIYGARGELQIIADTLEPWGEGRLTAAFEELKRRLAAEGLFDLVHKRDLPNCPNRIFVISSPTGAAIRDFIRTACDRFPGIPISICPSSVQGEGAPGELIQALEFAESLAGDQDVIVITRGGGSLEDLWAFNSEELVRKIYSCKVPVVSAIGHEIDFTLCDLVADQRAATPTAAAHHVLPSRQEFSQLISGLELRLSRAMDRLLASLRQELDGLSLRLRHPGRDIMEKRSRLDELERRLVFSITHRIERLWARNLMLSQRLYANSPAGLLALNRQQLDTFYSRLFQAILSALKAKRAQLAEHTARLNAVSPLACLDRGYSLVYHEKDDILIKSSSQVQRKDRLKIILSRGRIVCEVVDTDGPETK